MLIVIVFVNLAISFAQPREDFLSNSDDIALREMVLELKNMVLQQSGRIAALEQKSQSLEENNRQQLAEIGVLRKKVVSQDRKILKFNQNYLECEKEVQRLSEDFRNLGKHGASHKTLNSTRVLTSWNKRLLTTQTTVTPNTDSTVAFYAYASQKTPSPSSHFILTFDTIITNAGDSFHHHSGTFYTPRTGLYVFTWSFRVQNDAHISTELVVNNVAKGAVYFDAHPGVGGNSAGTVVVHVNQGDDVFVRTTQFQNIGDILSDHIGRTYFAGWLLV